MVLEDDVWVEAQHRGNRRRHSRGGAAGGTSSGRGAGPHASPVVHADETGWRQNGENGYVWTYSTLTGRF